MGLVFEPRGACFHRFHGRRGISEPLFRLGFSAFQALYDQRQVLGARALPGRHHQIRRLSHQPLPIRGQGAERLQRLAGLPDGPAGDRRPLAQRLHALALDLGLSCDADEFVIAHGEGRKIEPIGLDDAAIWATAPVALALLVVADHEDPGLEQHAIEHLHARRRQAKEFLLALRRWPGDRPRACFPIARHRLLHQPRHQLEGVRRQAEIGFGLLKRGQQAQRLGAAGRQSGKTVGAVAGCQHRKRDPARAGDGARRRRARG